MPFQRNSGDVSLGMFKTEQEETLGNVVFKEGEIVL